MGFIPAVSSDLLASGRPDATAQLPDRFPRPDLPATSMSGDALHRHPRRIGTFCSDSILSRRRRVVEILGALRPASTLFCSETPYHGSRAPSPLMSPARAPLRLRPELEMEDLLQSSNLSATGCTKRWNAIRQDAVL